MAFVLPAKIKTAAAPKPADGAVAVRELPPEALDYLRKLLVAP